MAGVITSYQTGVHGSRPAVGAGCIFYSCTTHGLVYRSDGTTWTTFLTLPSGSVAATPALTFGTAAAAGSSGTFVNSDATLPIFDATVPTTQAFSDAAAAGAAGVAARRDHKHGMPASPGGGGLSQSFVGYNTIGGTWTAMVAHRHYVKKITVATAFDLLSVDAHIRGNADNVINFVAFFLDDNAGAPGKLLSWSGTLDAAGNVYLSTTATVPGAGSPGRWFSSPVSGHYAAGDYWIGVVAGTTYAARIDLANDGSGTDVHYTASAEFVVGGYAAAYAQTTSAIKNSVRASIHS